MSSPHADPDPHALARRIRRRAHDLGFDLAGFAAAAAPDHLDAFARWIESGAAGEMDHLRRTVGQRGDPASLLPGAASAVMVGMLCDAGPRHPPGGEGSVPEPGEGRPSRAAPPIEGVVARYARGRDYHEILGERLAALLDRVRVEADRPVRGFAFVDTAPVLEKDLAVRAGLGWIGKNTLLVHPSLGSFFMLGGLLLDIPLPADTPWPDRCGSCTRCLDACPTGALTAPRVLDARRCLAYHNIESREAIPEDLRAVMGSLVFGCDLCQEACPYNRRARAAPEPDFAPSCGAGARLDLAGALALDADACARRFAHTPLARRRRRALARNALVALGNSGRAEAAPIVRRALDAESDPMVREHAEWALRRLCGGV
jgi:epoxyqueuosine reductase